MSLIHILVSILKFMCSDLATASPKSDSSVLEAVADLNVLLGFVLLCAEKFSTAE